MYTSTAVYRVIGLSVQRSVTLFVSGEVCGDAGVSELLCGREFSEGGFRRESNVWRDETPSLWRFDPG